MSTISRDQQIKANGLVAPWLRPEEQAREAWWSGRTALDRRMREENRDWPGQTALFVLCSHPLLTTIRPWTSRTRVESLKFQTAGSSVDSLETTVAR